MSRCSICDHMEGYGSNVNILGKLNTRVRWRPQISQFLCDECATSINNTIVEMEKKDWDYTIDEAISNAYDTSASKFLTAERTQCASERRTEEPVD